eukprot:TRINITY_DN20215_c0_g1_i1.p1 TRINITY_DN20215_c0_g1~~TRINITY_DN20215_c0_g1_i1.p1  ORF type:complete len:208 (+),score=32.46 TRINITY_DN20215_c0_g1_i1:83-625(+)
MASPTPAFVIAPVAANSISTVNPALLTTAPQRSSLRGVSSRSSARSSGMAATASLALGLILGLGAASTRRQGGSRTVSRVQQRCSVDEYIAENEIVAFISSACPFCQRAVKELRNAGYEPKVVECPKGSSVRTALQEKTNSSSVPKVWIKGNFIGGCNDGGLGGVVPCLNNGKIKEIMEG